MRQPLTLSDLLAASRNETFIGRERELAWFGYELERASPQTVLWWVHGPAGVGKSALLHRWLLRAQSLGRATGIADGESLDPIAAMTVLAAQLASQGRPLEAFEQHLTAYTSLWSAISADPEAPRGQLARHPAAAGTPLTRAQAELEPLTPRDLATHLRRRRKWSPDQITLALEGTRLLTESFVVGLRSATAEGSVVIAFDEWERLSPWLERWLLGLLTGNAMRLPASITWILAGREPPSDAWAPLRPATATVALGPLPPTQAARLVTPFVGLSTDPDRQMGGAVSARDPRSPDSPSPPLWLEPLLGILPDEDGAARLLSDLPDPRERAVLLAAAIPRSLDQLTLEPVLNGHGRAETEEWLTRLSHAPYIRVGSSKLQLNATVRTTLLRYLRRDSPLDEAEGHLALANSDLPFATRLYHRLMARRARALPDLLAAVLDAIESDAAALPALGEALLAAARDSESPSLLTWAAELQAILRADDPLRLAQRAARALADQRDGAPALTLTAETRTRILLLLGRSLERADWATARACYSEATTITPNLSAAWFHLGRAYLATEASAEALAALTRAEQLDPQEPHILHARAVALRRLGQPAEALSVLDRALVLLPADPDLLTTQGELLALQSDNDGALAAFDAALEQDEQAILAWVGRGEVLSQLGRFDEALAAFEQALRVVPDASFVLASKGETLRQMKRLAEAIADFVSALTLNPVDVFAWSNMGKTLRQMNRFEEALDAFDRALTHGPPDPLVLALRGETLFQLGRYEEALAALDQALRLDETLPFAVAVRGETLRELGRFDDALAAFDHALDLNPGYAWALASKGQTLRRMGRLEQALTTAERALALTPDDPWIWAEKGETLRLMGRFDDARPALEQAVALDPDYAWAWSSLAQTLRALEDLPAALHAVQRALEGAPEVLWLWIEQIELLLLLHRYDEAASAARAHVERDPENDWAHFLMAVAAQARHERREFNAAISQAIRLASAMLNSAEDPDQQALALFNRALYRLVQANPRAACADYEHALELECEERIGDALEDLDFLKAAGVWLPTWQRMRTRLEERIISITVGS